MSNRGKINKLPYKEDEIQSMFKDYYDDLDFNTLYLKHNVSSDTFRYLRRKYNKPARILKSQRVVKFAVNDHINGMLLKDVEKKYNISSSTIYKYMKKHGIEYKNDHGRRHHLNQNFFEKIDTEKKAYWLGFLYADGCVTYSEKSCNSPNRLSINLSSKDRCILELFQNDLESDYPIVDYIPNGKTYGNTMMSKLYINSTKLCKDLIKHGCVPNKTKCLQMPYGSLDEKLYPHFLRGVFDGDGCITSTKGKRPTFQITGYKLF